MENYIGRLLDNRYEILEVIGTGGMAVVYKARCHRLNRLVAIKILKDELSQDAEFRRRFHAESQAVAMLSHPNIVNVYDVSHSDREDYIVMELIDGISLKQYMEQKGALNWREVLHFSTQIAKALEHAHSRGIIHRDIKPHNIMVLKDGSVKVADFGIARVSSAQSTLTREALGSVHYISPEQARGSKIDYRSDLYSLGVVMYEMLTGRTPYDGETPVSVAIQHINARATLPRSINPQIPIGLEQITMHAMAADLNERYESATEMLRDLEEFRKNPSIQFNFRGAAPVHAAAAERPAPQRTSVAERTVRGKQESVRRPAASTPAAAPAKKPKSNGVGLVAGILCIALAVFGIGYFLYSFFLQDIFTGTEDLQVPSFVGKYADNIDYSAYPDFDIYIAEWVPSDSVEQGYVISQDPKADRMAKAGSSIALTVSSGLATDSMRDLVNQTLQNATTILDNLALNIQVEVVYENSDVIASGCVIRTVPGKGETLTEGQTVTLVVSDGTPIKQVEVPGLLGLSEERATQKLEDRGLQYELTNVDSDKAKGTVVYQSIEQGEMVKEGTTVNLQISNGPEENPDEDPDKDPDEDDPDNTDQPVTPTSPVTRIIDIHLPPDSDSVMTVSVYLDGIPQDTFEVNPVVVVDNKVQMVLEGVGVHQIDVYINNVFSYSMSYDFDTGEVLW